MKQVPPPPRSRVASCTPQPVVGESQAANAAPWAAERPAQAAYDANIAAGMKTPATSKLFVKFVDPKTGVVSYLVKPGSIAFNQQSTYFTAKSMTDDGRFLVFSVCDDEFPPEKQGKRVGVSRHKAVIDFLKDEVIHLEACGGIPFIDTVTDQMWYMDDVGVHRRDFLVDPKKDNLLCPVPPELVSGKGHKTRYGTHITFSPDRRLMFLDSCVNGQDVEGVIDTVTGKWTEWARSNFCCNHGQLNPKDPTLAMCAWESARFKVRDEMTPEEIAKAKFKGLYVSDLIRSGDDVYPRLWLFREGKAWEVTSKITGYATHEHFAADGKGFYWCSSGVSYHDLATGREWRINPIGSAHATMTADNRYIVSDDSWGGWWRGCGWTVQFWNRDTHRAVYVHSRRPRIASRANESKLHPDPHPHFACDDRYIISTFNDEERRLNVSVTPVDQLIAITTDPATAPKPKTFPLAFDPATRTDATYEMEIDVKPMQERKFVAPPACAVYSDSYTPFALRAVVNGKEGPLPFEAVQGSDYRHNVVLRFKLPEGTQKLFCVADAPGRFEYYDSESCANIFAQAYDNANKDHWALGAGVQAATHRGGLVFAREDTKGDAFPGASYTADLPAETAGRAFKFELDLRNLAQADWCGGVKITQLDAAGKELGDALAGQGLPQTLKWDRRLRYRLTGMFAADAKKVRLDIGLKGKDGTAAKVLVCRLNLREATVFPFTQPQEVLMKTPETSKNFVKHVDKTTKIVSYFLKPGLMDDTQQSWYDAAKSMTDDGRFLLFWTCPNENKPQKGKKRTAYVDFLTDTVHFIDIPLQISWLDVEQDKVYYIRRSPGTDRLCCRDLKADPDKEIVMDSMPFAAGNAAGHAAMTADNRYVTTDYPVAGWYRGCNWQVLFYDRETGKIVFPHYKNDRLCPNDGQWHNHPDPHPQFVCKDRYIICTVNQADGHMDLSVTPVEPLKKMTQFAVCGGDNVREFWFDALPKEASPMDVGGRIVRQFLSSPPDNYFPKGATKLHAKNYVAYAIVSTWVNALEYATRTHNAYLADSLAARFTPFMGPKKKICSKPDHVDFSIFGSVPMAVSRVTGNAATRAFGVSYADKQWTKPAGPEEVRIGKNEVDIPYEERLKFFEQGYTAQTRLWIDDMYMITVLQTQAYLTTGDRKYLDRAAKEMCLYLDRLQLKEGKAKGLFYHAPDVPFVWGRGDGWMAGGMALLLRHLPEDSEYRPRIMKGYKEMMAALLKFQRPDGMWGQLVDEPDSWAESSGTAMFTSAFITGVRRGWLDGNAYGPAARKAWIALCSRLDRYGNLSDICVGTGKKNDHQYYLDRPRMNGDPHGQAPMLWCVNAMLAK